MKKLTLIDVHDYPSKAQYEFAQRAKALAAEGRSWPDVAQEMKDARGTPADVKGVEMAAAKWGHHTGYYTVYWEIGMNYDNPNRVPWEASIIDYESGQRVASQRGWNDSEEEARRDSQTWVLSLIENFRQEAA